MQASTNSGRGLFAALTLAVSASVSAAPVSYVNESVFRGALAGSANSDGFEGLSGGETGIPAFSVGGLAAGATLLGTQRQYTDSLGNPAVLTGKIGVGCQAADKDTDACSGRYNTTPGANSDKLWGTALSFDILFGAGNSFKAFGFNLIDYGDFDGSLTLDLLNEDGTVKAGPAITVAQPGSTDNGTKQFFGLTDAQDSFFGVRFNIGQTATAPTRFDWLGFDDLLTGNLPTNNTVPEPGTWALVAISLAGVALTRRRRS